MQGRRKTIKRLVEAGVVTGVSSHWAKPVINSVLLPAHAETSALLPPKPTPPPTDQVSTNTPPQGENVVIDAQGVLPVRYDMLPHLSDAESPASELTLVVVSLARFGVIEFFGSALIVYQLKPEFVETHTGADQFTYRVLDPEGASSPVYTVDIINLPSMDQ